MQLPTTGYGLSFPNFASSGNAHQAMLDGTNQSGFANGPGRAPRKLKDITDGLSKTLIIAETARLAAALARRETSHARSVFG